MFLYVLIFKCFLCEGLLESNGQETLKGGSHKRHNSPQNQKKQNVLHKRI